MSAVRRIDDIHAGNPGDGDGGIPHVELMGLQFAAMTEADVAAYEA